MSESINQSWILVWFRWNKITSGSSEGRRIIYRGSMIMPGTRPETEMFSDAGGKWTETEQISRCPACRLFQMVGPATGKAQPPTIDSLTDGPSRRLVRAGRSATIWFRYDGAVPWVVLYMSTAILKRTLSWARSQWRAMSASEMWSEWRRP